jgi:uncharacterized protein involved in exopolysaccharide biosynthesis
MNPAEGIAALAFFAVIGFIGFPLARAFAQRISGGTPNMREVDALRDEVAQLRGEVDTMHDRLAGVDELQNRVDFAERMIAQLKKPALPGMLAQAISQRIMHGVQPKGGAVSDGRMDDLSGEVAALRQQLYETQERLDFAERMLARQKDPGALGAGQER